MSVLPKSTLDILTPQAHDHDRNLPPYLHILYERQCIASQVKPVQSCPQPHPSPHRLPPTSSAPSLSPSMSFQPSSSQSTSASPSSAPTTPSPTHLSNMPASSSSPPSRPFPSPRYPTTCCISSSARIELGRYSSPILYPYRKAVLA